MIPEIGQFALILALMLALTLAVLPQIGASRGISQLVAMARPTAQAQFIFVAIAFACLAYSFINNDFSVLNVATNSNSQLPLQYRLAATWGSHEGSLLLWTFMLTIWRSEEHTSELQSPCISYAVFCLKKKTTRLNSSHLVISYAVFCLKKKK